jgi:abortive infection bacteriophage resistance protein
VVADPKALKPYKTYPDQLAQLEGRGLTVADRSAALAALQRLGYYRLSGYFYALRKTNPVGKPGRQNDFETGASFELVVALADFDKRLRLLALDAIESVEIAVRVAIAYRLGKFDPLAHLQPRLLDGRFTQQRPGQAQSRHQDWIARFEEQCSKSREEFMQHHREVYGGQVPIWAAIDPMTQNDIVQKLWNLCDVLRDDGINYSDYVTELVLLLFIKMEHENHASGILQAQAARLRALARAQRARAA